MYTQDQQRQVISDILHSMRNPDKSGFYFAFDSAGSPDQVEAWVKENGLGFTTTMYGFNIRPMINTYLVYWKAEGYPASFVGKPAWRAIQMPKPSLYWWFKRQKLLLSKEWYGSHNVLHIWSSLGAPLHALHALNLSLSLTQVVIWCL